MNQPASPQQVLQASRQWLRPVIYVLLRCGVTWREFADLPLDVNGDGVEFPGLTYGSQTLEELLRELGVIFTPQTLHDPQSTPSGVKEFRLSARWTWGHDRVM